MSRVKKRVWGIVGLLAVAAMTITAAIMPTVGVYAAASADLLIQIEVESIEEDFGASFTNPTDGANLTHATGTGRIHYNNAKSIRVNITGPGGYNVDIDIDLEGVTDGYVDFTYLLDEYGDYVFTITGTDLDDGPAFGQSITVHYHSGNFDIENSGNKGENPRLTVNFGPEVCGVGFQLYSLDPADDPDLPLLDPAFTILDPEFKELPGFATGTVTISIPLIEEYDLPAGVYRIVMTTYDCDGSVIEDGLEANDGAYFIFNPDGGYVPPEPDVPDTGLFTIGGISIARSDLIITGICVALALIIVYFFLRTRRKIRA